MEQRLDETGELEELTWDLFPLVPSEMTVHLEGQGIPKVGTVIRKGMIVIGRIARTLSYDPKDQPSSFEASRLPINEIHEQFGHMWRDESLYATEEMEGVIVAASIESHNGRLVAVVEIEPQ